MPTREAAVKFQTDQTAWAHLPSGKAPEAMPPAYARPHSACAGFGSSSWIVCCLG
jgi:hypothetical protein